MWNRLGIPICDACVYCAKNNADQCKEAGLSLLIVERNKGKRTLFYSCFGNCQMLANKISTCEVCIIWWKLIAACKIQCKSPSQRHDGLTTLDWFRVHGATLSACIRESAYVPSHVGCGTVQQTLFLNVSQIYQRWQKMMRINRILKLS